MTTTDPTPASMGGPLSEADRLAEIRARVAAAKPRPETHWRKPLLASGEMRRHAEADVVFLLTELDRTSARVGVLEGQLATARERHKPVTDERYVLPYCNSCSRPNTDRKRLWPCPDAKALGLDGGGSDA